MEAEVSRIAVSAISVPLSREEPRSVPIAHASHGFVTDHLWVVIATLSLSLLFSIVICACFGAVHIPVSSAVQALLLRHPLTETQRIILYTRPIATGAGVCCGRRCACCLGLDVSGLISQSDG